ARSAAQRRRERPGPCLALRPETDQHRADNGLSVPVTAVKGEDLELARGWRSCSESHDEGFCSREVIAVMQRAAATSARRTTRMIRCGDLLTTVSSNLRNADLRKAHIFVAASERSHGVGAHNKRPHDLKLAGPLSWCAGFKPPRPRWGCC